MSVSVKNFLRVRSIVFLAACAALAASCATAGAAAPAAGPVTASVRRTALPRGYFAARPEGGLFGGPGGAGPGPGPGGGGAGVEGVLYEPVNPGPKAGVVIVVMHSDSDYTNFHMGNDMAERGYTVLCANVSNSGADLDQKLLDVKAVVAKLRERSETTKIVLMGHSGGATLMSAYQAVAENGPAVFQGESRIHQAPDSLAGLPPADGLMLLDANWGNAPMMVFSLDPAVKHEYSGTDIDESLNLWNPANGFSPDGSTFSPEFVARFARAQSDRNNRIVDAALERLAAMNAGAGYFVDDEPLVIPGGDQSMFNNKLYAQDVSLLAHTKNPWPLLKPDGGVSVEVVYSVRKPTNNRSLTGSYSQGALHTTVKNFLASYAIRTLPNYGFGESEVFGLDYDSSYCTALGNVRDITAPLLAAGMTGSWEYLAAETIYENAKSADKTIVFVEGASHLFTTATETEAWPGQWGDTKKTLYDYVDTWLSERFL